MIAMSPITVFLQLSCIVLTAWSMPFSKLQTRDVVTPPITSPTKSTVWVVGANETVTWATAGLPPPENITNILGQVWLGYLLPGSDDEHLDIDNPLAAGFNITDGAVNITVPDVVPRSTYFLVLFGDSGNNGPEFTITNTTTSSSSSHTTTDSTSFSSTSIVVSPPTTISSGTETVASTSVTGSISVPISFSSLPTATSPIPISSGSTTLSGSTITGFSSPSSGSSTSTSSSSSTSQTTTTSGALSRRAVSQASLALVPLFATLFML